jgi:hypothetical protein
MISIEIVVAGTECFFGIEATGPNRHTPERCVGSLQIPERSRAGAASIAGLSDASMNDLSLSGDEAKFNRLAGEWKSAAGIYSSVTKVAMHPAYQQMIGMGSTALPFIFARLVAESDEPDHWFWALAAISAENPVPKESRGKINDMASAWLAWGKEKGYVRLG